MSTQLFVAVGGSGTVKTSPTGAVWTNQTTPVGDNLLDITFGAGLLVAIGGGDVITSPDAVNWTARTAADPSAIWVSVVYGAGKFVAVGVGSGGGQRIMTSPDGITWTLQTGAGAADNLPRVAFGAGLFVISGYFDLGSGGLFQTSPDGITWTPHTIDPTWADLWEGLDFLNSIFVAQGRKGGFNTTMTSPDGLVWTLRTSAVIDPCLKTAYGASTYCACSSVNGNGLFMTSPNASAWTTQDPFGPGSYFYNGVAFGAGLFAAAGYDGSITGVIVTSPDGVTWTYRPTSTGEGLSNIAFLTLDDAVEQFHGVLSIGPFFAIPGADAPVVPNPRNFHGMSTFGPFWAIPGAGGTTPPPPVPFLARPPERPVWFEDTERELREIIELAMLVIDND